MRVGADQEESPGFRQPFPVYPFQGANWVVQMFQNMCQNNVVIPIGQINRLKGRVDDLYLVIQLPPCGHNGLVRSFHACDIVKIRDKSFCEFPSETSQFQEVSLSSKGLA